MLKNARLPVSKVQAIGMNPIAKAVDVDFDRKCTYQQFCKAIKQKFPDFDRKSYIIYFDKMAGVDLNRDNFPEFLERINTEGNQFGQAHIHKTPIETSVGFDNSSSSSSGEEEEEEDPNQKIERHAAIIEDDDEMEKPQRRAFLHKALKGDPTDPSVKLTKDDCRFLENMRVVSKSKPPMASFKEMKQKLVIHIVKDLQEV